MRNHIPYFFVMWKGGIMSVFDNTVYVHWLKDNSEDDSKNKEACANYFLAKKEIQVNNAYKIYSRAIRNQFTGGQEELDRYLDSLKSIIKDESFTKALDSVNLQLPSFQEGDQSRPTIEALAKQLEMKSDSLDDIIKRYKDIISFLGSNIDIQKIQYSSIVSNTLNNKTMELFDIKSTTDGLINAKEYKAWSGYYRKIYSTLVEKVNDFASQVNSLEGSALATVDPTDLSKMITDIANSIRPIMGILSEYLVESEFEKITSDFTDKLEKEQKGLDFKISKAKERRQGNEIQTFTKKTKDLEININPQKNANQVNAKFSFDKGGITLKRTTEGKEEHTINLKGKSTKLKGYIEHSELDLEKFYNVFANNSVFNSDVTTSMYNYVHELIKAKALAGSLTQDDICVLMIINNKVYTIFDLLEEEIKESSILKFTIAPKLPSLAKTIDEAHKWEQPKNEKISSSVNKANRVRSDKIIKLINKQHIGVMLQMRGSFFK